jgi:hypothetical protein
MSDKRSVHTDALDTLGTIIENGERDAIHLAVEPVVAGCDLAVGHDVGIGEDGKAYHKDWDRNIKLVGIVDPFLKRKVKAGERFWLVVYPRQITSLRHVWSHPDFPEANLEPQLSTEEKKKESELWLRDYCENFEGAPTYYNILAAVEDGYGIRDDYFHFNGQDASGMIPDEFWDHIENIVGRPMVDRPTHFSCSC